MSLNRLMQRLIPIVITFTGVVFLIVTLLSGYDRSFANRLLDSPVIFNVKGRDGSTFPGNWITADTRPIVSGFATAAGSRIILSSNGEAVSENIIAIDHPDYPEPLWEYTFQSDLTVGEVYELTASEVLSDESPVGSSDIFYMAILNATDSVFMPMSLLPEPTLLPTATPVPILLNGNFESGQQNWTFNSSALGASVVNNGQSITANSALIGSPGYVNNGGVPEGFGEIFQTINVPEDGGILTFNYRIYTHDRMANSSGALIDTFEVYINRQPTTAERIEACTDTNKQTKPVYLEDITILCSGNPANASQNGPAAIVIGSPLISLNDFKGQSVNLIIRVYNREDNFYNTWAYIDDFQVFE